MRSETQRYLEHLCDAATIRSAPGATDPDRARAIIGAGVEPSGFGHALRFSPTRTKAVMRELLQHHLLDIGVVVGSDGRNELRMTANRETVRWYARALRARAREKQEPHVYRQS